MTDSPPDDKAKREESEQQRRELAEKIEALSLRISRMTSGQLDDATDCLDQAAKEPTSSEKKPSS